MPKDWGRESIRRHAEARGKLEVVPKVPVRRREDFSIWYTPGVAGPARAIAEEGPERANELTWRWNTVAVVSDGTRVLGLGDVGPYAALPVMEGKALLFKVLGGVDAVPIVTNLRGVDELVSFVKALEPSFGGVNLEDIESPKCFTLLERLREELDIPVWHDDQQGTALVVLAALINAFKLVGKDMRRARIVLFGLGAANYSVLRYLRAYGIDTGNVVVVERPGIGVLGPNHPRLEEFRRRAPHWYEASLITNREGLEGGPEEAFRGADAVIAASRPGPGTIRPEWVRLMADKPIVFALANPVPEIAPEKALEAGAYVVATGRSDYPNQVNNSLGFPAVFRGALSSWARKISDGMCVAAAEALARHAEEGGLRRDYIIPAMDDAEAYVKEAWAVAEAAYAEGLARRRAPLSEVKEEIREMIMRARPESLKH